MGVAIEASSRKAAWVPEADTWRQVTGLFLVLFVITLLAWSLEDRQLAGVNVWNKPLKFQASLALHFLTLALLAGLLSPATRRRKAFGLVVATSTAAGLFEISYIMLQAARGRASHFNEETNLEAVMYALMGLGSLVLVAAPFALGIWLLRESRRGIFADPLRFAAALGLISSAIATAVVAGYMSMRGGHAVGAETFADGLPVTGWSRQAGDLRVSHFLATHAMQILPLAGLALRNAGVAGSRWIAVGGGAYLLLVVAAFVQALYGRPLAG